MYSRGEIHQSTRRDESIFLLTTASATSLDSALCQPFGHFFKPCPVEASVKSSYAINPPKLIVLKCSRFLKPCTLRFKKLKPPYFPTCGSFGLTDDSSTVIVRFFTVIFTAA